METTTATKKTKANRAPIGSLWMGKVWMKVDGIGEVREYVTVRIESDPIPGNDLRHVVVTSSNHEGKKLVMGANCFRARTGSMTRIA